MYLELNKGEVIVVNNKILHWINKTHLEKIVRVIIMKEKKT
jgi:hypothetical protein